MDDAQAVVKPKRAYKRNSPDGQTGINPIGAGAHVSAEDQKPSERVAITWAEFDKKIYAWELAHRDKRITRIFFDGEGAPEHFQGVMSECGLSHGKPSIRLSSGDILEI